MAQKDRGQNLYPDLAQCEKLWDQYHTPPHVIRHCVAVAKTASLIGRRLNEKGYQLNIPLIEASGLLHDIVRTEDFHWEKGANIAGGLGYNDVAGIIRLHMKYRIDGEKEEITETDLICLADRVVKEDRYVGPDERMDYIIHKAEGEPGAEKRIRESYRHILALKRRIERTIGMSMEDLMCSE